MTQDCQASPPIVPRVWERVSHLKSSFNREPLTRPSGDGQRRILGEHERPRTASMARQDLFAYVAFCGLGVRTAAVCIVQSLFKRLHLNGVS